MSTAIEFNHVGKQYRLGLVSTRTLSHDLNRWWQTSVLGKEDPYLKIGETNDRTTMGESEYVWALRDIDFKVEKGDVVGIIGKNGAGKSTLLKLLSKVTGPTVGTIRARGRIGALLEVGTGFHPEMTGRENIYMNGAIMGMTKNDIALKLDEIVAFSGCERYIDTPVKRYSSGMTVRLGFAVAAHLDPEILVVDEVLAVGDAEFQKKAIGKMQDVSRGEGRTVLFVSHNMASIKSLCNSGILLENGHIKYTGAVNDVVEKYIGGDVDQEDHVYNDLSSAPGNEVIRVQMVTVTASNGSSSIDIESGITFHIRFACFKSDKMLDVNIEVKNMEDTTIFQVGNVLGEVGEKDSKIGIYDVKFVVPPYVLNAGKYKAIVFWGENQAYLVYREEDVYFEVRNTLSDMGFNHQTAPGYIRLKNDFIINFNAQGL